ncbi:hypothetical protein BJ138DRAFT_776434 [Hygrophoropsis aurantiaca]|uniref:Uncharacterized protein n=1 Tax=Hygrophoropsis aurantiaca TaxID=72124 RepID=A0ACB8AGU2_9AGAM|nr:hypothetical protein BJ138DRAFT_776434 [Hygrophoropsis aurantiaca]
MALLYLLGLSLLALLGAASPPLSLRDNTPGTISSPPDGSAIAPGANFDFSYNTRADYGISSYNYTVWLWSSLPGGVSQQFATGHYFGRFSEENYPGNPNPQNPAPPQLTMPDLADSLGGFGAGAYGSNIKLYLVVIEEWGSGQGSLGTRFSQTSNALIYNATIATR